MELAYAAPKSGDKEQHSLEAIKLAIGDKMEEIDVTHNWLLVGIYMRPERSKGGIILTDKTRDEDRWQNKVGWILKKGPLAFVSDERNSFPRMIENGECVLSRTSDGFGVDFYGIHCRLIEDVHVKAVVANPEAIW